MEQNKVAHSQTGQARKEGFERRSSKNRLSKQDEVEEMEGEDNSPSSEASDATIVPTVDVEAPGEVTQQDISSQSRMEPQIEPRTPVESGDSLEIQLQSQQSIESDKSSPTQGNIKQKHLVRSHALCDDSSPPPEDHKMGSAGPPHSTSPLPTATLTVSPTPTHRKMNRHKLSKDNSQGSVISENGTSPGLSRDSSFETQYTDSTGVDLEEFIKNTLNKNSKDRSMMLKLEQDLISFIKENKAQIYKFPQMTSYHRMLVHRSAAFFGLDHNVDQSGKCVVVNKTANTRLPDFSFQDHIDDSEEQTTKKQILKRGTGASLDENRSPDRISMDGKKSKSFEERTEEYHRARERIFNQEGQRSHKEVLGVPGTSVEINVSEMTDDPQRKNCRNNKDDMRQWHSYESSGYSTDSSGRPANMTKASSFSGVSVLSRDNSRSSTMSSLRSLSKADSFSSGVSLTSPMTRPPPIQSSPPAADTHLAESSHGIQNLVHHTDCMGNPIPCLQYITPQGHQTMAIWVASNFDVIPPGSHIINPQTGQPHLNQDGSMYTWQHKPQTQQLLTVPTSGQQHQHNYQQQQYQTQQQQQPEQSSYVESSGSGSDLSSQMSMMTLTSQSSVESVPPPPQQGVGESTYAAPPQQQQQEPSSSVYVQQGTAVQQPVQPQPQQQFQQPQVQYVSQGGTVRYMYPVGPYNMQRTPGPDNTQQQGQHNFMQYPGGVQSQQPGYQVVNYPNMSVQNVETYPTYQQQVMAGYQQNTQQASGGIAEQPTPGGPVMVNSSQYQSVTSQPNIGQHVYYNTSTSNALQGVSFVTSGGSQTTPFRTQTPPSQIAGAAQPPQTNGGGTPGPAPGAPTQYIYNTYPGAQPAGAAPAPPRGNTPTQTVLPAYATPLQTFQVRPGAAVNIAVRPTTPPFQPGVISHGTAVKMIPIDQRSGDTVQKEFVQGNPTVLGMKPVVHVPHIVPTYRQTTPVIGQTTPTLAAGDMMMVGTPLRQPFAPFIPPNGQHRPRAPTPTASNPPSSIQTQQNKKASAAGAIGVLRKSQRKDGQSPGALSSTESTDSDSTSLMWEVICVPPNAKTLKKNDLPKYLDDLTACGATLHFIPNNPMKHEAGVATVADATVIATFADESAVQRAKSQSQQKGGKYKLRPSSRQYDAATLQSNVCSS